MFPATRVAELLGTRYPIVQAPMAGGFTTPELVAAVSAAGGLGSIGGALLAPEELREAIAAVRRLTDKPFGVNLFAPLPHVDVDTEAVAAMNAALAPLRAELGLPEPETALSVPPTAFSDQVAVIAEERVPVFSFAFGTSSFEPAKEAGAVVLGTATTVAEAAELESHGVDAVVAQGCEAGGHRGTFRSSFDAALVGGIALVPQVVDHVTVPVLLAGGVMDGRGIAAALALGAEGVQLGTAFLACPESGTPELHRRALAEAADDATTVTDVYTGRPARAIRGSFADAVEGANAQPLPFPLQGVVTADIRNAAATQGRTDLLFMLAGQGASLVRDLPAGELVTVLAQETEEAIRRLAQERAAHSEP
jgi:nitronate monooxygenase